MWNRVLLWGFRPARSSILVAPCSLGLGLGLVGFLLFWRADGLMKGLADSKKGVRIILQQVYVGFSQKVPVLPLLLCFGRCWWAVWSQATVASLFPEP